MKMDDSAEMRELLALYAEYVKLLEASEGSLTSIAYVHGFQMPEAFVQRGKELRRRIAELRAPADLDAPPPQSKIFSEDEIFRRPIEEGEFEE
jgi:hypothetical protein